MDIMAAIRDIFERSMQEADPARLEHFILAFVVTIFCISAPNVWPTMRNVVTLVHEYGHAIVGLMTGRKLTGIKLHSDTSGATTTAGRVGLLGMLSFIPTVLAGYTFPGLVGTALLYSSSQGKPRLVLSICFLLVLAILPFMRNFHGLLVTSTVLLALGTLVYYAPDFILQGVVTTTGVFLVAGGFVAIIELGNHHRQGRGQGSDADQLGLGIDALAKLWVGIFLLYASGSVIFNLVNIYSQLSKLSLK